MASTQHDIQGSDRQPDEESIGSNIVVATPPPRSDAGSKMPSARASPGAREATLSAPAPTNPANSAREAKRALSTSSEPPQKKRRTSSRTRSPSKASPPKDSASPAKGPEQRQHPQFVKTEISDSESSLSSLGTTPPPPSPIRRKMARVDIKLECTCKGWCTCPKHAAYPSRAPPHLSEWALSQMNAPVSAERQTLRATQDVHSNNRLSEDGKSACTEVKDLFLELATANGRKGPGKHAAGRLLRGIKECFPAAHMNALPNPPPTGIECVLCTLRAWSSHGSLEVLWASFGEAMEGHPDLLVLFQDLMPSEWSTVGKDELWDRKIEGLPWDVEGRPKALPCGWVGKRSSDGT